MSDPNNPSNPPPHNPQHNPPPPSSVPPPPPAQAQPVDYQRPGAGGYPGPYIGPPADSDSRTMAMLAHLLGILTSFLGPLIIWLVKKDEKPFVDDQGKEALNFHITMIIAWLISIPLGCLTFGLAPLALWVAIIVFGILACVEANKGNAYRYPINIRFIK